MLIGVALIGFGLLLTKGTYHPLPPGEPHVDGRGLFAPLLITPAAALGGIFLAKSLMVFKQLQARSIVRLFVYLMSAVVAVSLPVSYMVFYTGPDMSSKLSTYYDWYMFSPILSTLSVITEETLSWLVSRGE